jgi:hypothetical protein
MRGNLRWICHIRRTCSTGKGQKHYKHVNLDTRQLRMTSAVIFYQSNLSVVKEGQSLTSFVAFKRFHYISNISRLDHRKPVSDVSYSYSSPLGTCQGCYLMYFLKGLTSCRDVTSGIPSTVWHHVRDVTLFIPSTVRPLVRDATSFDKSKLRLREN